MFFDELTDYGVVHMSDALEALAELEKNTRQSIAAQRSSKRLDIQTRVRVRPGNSSRRNGMVIEGLTADISNGGCMLLLPCPVMVGDIFWLEFTDERIRIDSLLVRCLRCRFVREDAFETGIRFLNNIDVMDAVVDSSLLNA